MQRKRSQGLAGHSRLNRPIDLRFWIFMILIVIPTCVFTQHLTSGWFDHAEPGQPLVPRASSETLAVTNHAIRDALTPSPGRLEVERIVREGSVLSKAWEEYDLSDKPHWLEVTTDEMTDWCLSSYWTVRGTVEVNGQRHEIVGTVTGEGAQEEIELNSRSTVLADRANKVRHWRQEKERAAASKSTLDILSEEYGLADDTKWHSVIVREKPRVISDGRKHHSYLWEASGELLVDGVVCISDGLSLVAPDGEPLSKDSDKRRVQLQHVKKQMSAWKDHLERTTQVVRNVIDSPDIQIVHPSPTIEVDGFKISALVVSDSGRLLAVAHDDSVTIHDLHGQEQIELIGQHDSVSTMKFSSDEKRLLAGSGSGSPSQDSPATVLEWELGTGQLVRQFAGRDEFHTEAEKRQQAVFADALDADRLRFMANRTEVGFAERLLHGVPLREIFMVDYYPSGDHVLVETDEGVFKVGTAFTQRITEASPAFMPRLQSVKHRLAVPHLGCVPLEDGSSIAFVDDSTIVEGLDVIITHAPQGETRYPLVEGKQLHSRISAQAPENQILVCVSENSWRAQEQETPGSVIMVNAATGMKRVFRRGGVPFSSGICLSPDGKTLAVEVGATIELWDVENSVVTHRFEGASQPLFFRDSSRLAMVRDGSSVAIVSHSEEP